MSKYKDYLTKMLNENKEEFNVFNQLHAKYSLDQDKWQEEFNREGEKILEIVREYENRLCRNTERGMYNKFSTQLAEKFQNEVRKTYPLIDNVGIHVETFSIKKINLKLKRKINL